MSKNPDQRDKVYHTDRPERAHGHGHGHGRGPRGQGDDDGEGSSHQPDPTAHLYNPDGTLRDPKRSYYYDATYNPFGVPPPGMPYRARSEYKYGLLDAGRVVTTGAPGSAATALWALPASYF